MRDYQNNHYLPWKYGWHSKIMLYFRNHEPKPTGVSNSITQVIKRAGCFSPPDSILKLSYLHYISAISWIFFVVWYLQTLCIWYIYVHVLVGDEYWRVERSWNLESFWKLMTWDFQIFIFFLLRNVSNIKLPSKNCLKH